MKKLRLYSPLRLSGFVALATANVTLSRPIDFTEALKSREIRSVLATTLGTADLEEISSDILERSIFSARTTYAGYLQTLDDLLRKYLRGEIDQASMRLALQQKLQDFGYLAEADEAGAIKDLASDERINLVIRTNAEMAAGYGNWMQGQSAAVLDQWPAQELYRAFARKTHRNWKGDTHEIAGEPLEGRWKEAGGKISDGRMIARKNSVIWVNISRFGLPYPPFDFNSGMSVRDIDRRTAMKFGIIDRDTRIAPQTRGFNDDLRFTPDVRNAALRRVLEEEGYHFEIGPDGQEVLTL